MSFIDYKKKLDAIPGITNNDIPEPENLGLFSEYSSPYNIAFINMKTVSVEIPENFIYMNQEERNEWEASLPIKIKTLDPSAGL